MKAAEIRELTVVREVRRDLARIKTILREKERQAS